jgi:ABC-type transport system substrate-binding protein/class 3 adenylate cyclase/streptogramin lyase
VSASDRLGGTVTFVFTDIEGSTRLLRQLGRERYGELLARQQAVVRDAIAENGGEEIDTQGDSFFIAFRSSSSAVSAAVAIQRALAEQEWPDGVDVRVRVGIHTGEAAAAGERYVGFAVHRAARIGAAAHGGQVLLSSSTHGLVEDDLPLGVTLRNLGLYRLKDVERPEPISQVLAKGLRTEFPPLRGAARLRAPVLRRRSVLAAALVGVVAAAIAIPVLALSSSGSGDSNSSTKLEGNSVGAIDLASGDAVGAVPLDSSPNAVASGAGSVWVAITNRDVVVRINPTTNQKEQTITVHGGPSALTVGDGFVWVANNLAGTVAQIDPLSNGGQVVGDPIRVGNGPTGIAYGLGAVWVANSVDGTLVRIDPDTGHTSAPIAVDAGADAVAAGDGAVWVTSRRAGVLTKVDPAARSVLSTTNVGNEPVAVATGKGAVWVVNSEDGTVDRVDPLTGRVEAGITVGNAPSGVAAAQDGTVWVTNELSGSLSKIEPEATAAKTFVLGGSPQGIALVGAVGYVPVQESASAHRGGTLTVAISNPPGFYTDKLPAAFDTASGGAAWELTTMTNDGLLGYSRAGGADVYTVVPDLAVALPTVSDAGRTYTFELRRGIHYSTGATVQPADIRRGIERALLKSHGNPPGTYLGDIVGAKSCFGSESRCDLSRGIVTSAGSSTITFHLTSADPDFLYQLALPPFAAVPAKTPLKARLPLPATGPYKILGYQNKPTIVRLARNPHFRVWSQAAQPVGYPDRIVERYGYTGAAAVRAVEQGKADITTDGLDQTWSPAVLKSLETRRSSQLYPAPLLTILGLWLNTRLPPFNDVRVRQALNYAVDRNRLAQINGGAILSEVTCQILTPNINGYRRYCPFTRDPDATGTYHGPDLTRARRLVAASGTKGHPVTIWFYDIPVGRANGVYLVSVLRKLGYKATLETVPHTGPTWRPNRQAGVSGWGSDYPSPHGVFHSFTCDSYARNPLANANPASFCDRRLDAQIERAGALQQTDAAAAAKRWSSIDRQLTNDAPWVAMKVVLSTDFVARRTGNYRYCWLAGWTGLVSACLDQLWVR